MRAAAIIAAAGIGRRMGGPVPKQYMEIGGRPVICRTLDLFLKLGCVDDLVAVVEPGREEGFKEEILERFNFPKSWRVVAGGAVRQESVANGLASVSKDCDVVIVHDGVRPFVSPEKIEMAAGTAKEKGACILAVRVKETIKRASGEGVILETVDRESLFRAQTPQCFRREVICGAMEDARRAGFIGTDEASLVERVGGRVEILEGDERNIKITTPEDIAIAEALLKGRDS